MNYKIQDYLSTAQLYMYIDRQICTREFIYEIWEIKYREYSQKFVLHFSFLIILYTEFKEIKVNDGTCVTYITCIANSDHLLWSASEKEKVSAIKIFENERRNNSKHIILYNSQINQSNHSQCNITFIFLKMHSLQY